jgi:hypothetical protein
MFEAFLQAIEDVLIKHLKLCSIAANQFQAFVVSFSSILKLLKVNLASLQMI